MRGNPGMASCQSPEANGRSRVVSYRPGDGETVATSSLIKSGSSFVDEEEVSPLSSGPPPFNDKIDPFGLPLGKLPNV